ncbi:MAG: hypothetical protein K6F77_01035 [Lachnospiraceae bacterium]|nr:hypothetical protein [Lachnospiraceae bacterium]
MARKMVENKKGKIEKKKKSTKSGRPLAWKSLEAVLLEHGGEEVSPLEAYVDIFKLNEDYIQFEKPKIFKEEEWDDVKNLKGNPLGYYKNDDKEHGHVRIMFRNTFGILLKELQEADFAIMNCITYFGRKRNQNHASKMFAMPFDLDGVSAKSLRYFFQMTENDILPLPNYIALSGRNVHLYYVFDEPIPLFPNIKLQLKNFKYELTKMLWNDYTSDENVRQMQGIYQCFRVFGGKTKKRASLDRVKVYRMNKHPFSLRELCEYVPEEFQVDEKQIFKERKYTLAQARKKFPRWYARVIEGKDIPVSKWDISGKVNGDNPYALYDWWKKKILKGVTFHHRYFCVMALVIYGVKCNVPYEQVEQDAYDLMPIFNLVGSEDFTEADVKSALECYDERYATFPIDSLNKFTNIEIRKNKRNGRDQKTHMAIMRATEEVIYKNGSWRNKKGRPNKRKVVEKWQKANPKGKKAQCIRETGVDRKTVTKYWKSDVPNIELEPMVYNKKHEQDRIKAYYKVLAAYEEKVKEMENKKNNNKNASEGSD